MSFLQDFVHGNERLEGLDLIRQDGLNPKPTPERNGGVVIPRKYDSLCKRLEIKLELAASR
jgi:hypothetical protein